MKKLVLVFLLMAGICSAGEAERVEQRKILEQKVREGKATAAEYAQLGALRSIGGEHEKALEVYKEAARLEPDSAAYAINVALMYYYFDQREEAKSWFQKVQKLSPDDPRTREYLAAIAEIEKNMQIAREKAGKAAK